MARKGDQPQSRASAHACPSAIDPKTGVRYDTRCAPYRRGEVPFVPAMLVITIDRQGDRKKWIIDAFKKDGTAAIVEYSASRSARDMGATLRGTFALRSVAHVGKQT